MPFYPLPYHVLGYILFLKVITLANKQGALKYTKIYNIIDKIHKLRYRCTLYLPATASLS